jgi:6-bladed beta-propeller
MQQHASSRPVAIAAAALVCALGCTGRQEAAPPGSVADTVTTRDSAGLIIVENPSLTGVDSLSWTIDATPALTIGREKGEAPYLFSGIAGVVRQHNGTIVVANRKSRQLRFFDSTGAFVRAVGGAGAGPGEFSAWVDFQPALFAGPGDSLVVIDRGKDASLFDPTGVFVRKYTVLAKDSLRDALGDRARPSLVFGDGTFLVWDQTTSCTSKPGVSVPGPCEVRGVFRRVAEDGSVLANYGEHAVRRSEIIRSNTGLETEIAAFQSPPFWDARGMLAYFADARTFEWRVFAGTGALERIVRVRAPQASPDQLPEPARTPTDTANLPTSIRAFAKAIDDFERTAWRNASRPAHLRAYDGFIVDQAGNVWVKEYTVGRDSPPAGARWFVFDSLGVLRHAVRLPPGLVIEQTDTSPQPAVIDRDFVIAVTSDSLKVERVKLYRIRKGTSPS